MDFTITRFGDFALFKYGKMPKKSEIKENGKYPIYSGYRYVGYYDDYNTEANQLIIVARGVGGTGDVKLTKERCYLTNLSISAKIDESVVLPQYLYYYFSLRNLRYLDSGSAQSQITISDLEKVEIPLPNIESQMRIVGCLSMLDYKISTNEMINNNLEQQAMAIFKSWFVDFEPFGGVMPSEWSVSTLGSVSIMGAGGDKPQNVSQTKTDLYQYPIYSNGLSDEGLYGFTDKAKIHEESVTVSARGTIGFVCLRHIPYVPIVRLVTLIPKKGFISAKYLYLWLKQLHITGTGTTQQQLTVPDFQKTEILIPSQEIVTLFTTTVEPIFEKIWANQSENEKLSFLRDALLPKLMSGELDVSDIDF